MKPETDSVQVMMNGALAFARVVGRGSFKVSASLKEFGSRVAAMAGGRLVVDLSQCSSMDSTFMGVLAGLSFQFRNNKALRIQMVNVTPKLHGLIAILGLHHLVDLIAEGSLPEEYAAILGTRPAELQELPNEKAGTDRVARIMLEAHENLVKADGDNAARFKDVIAFLRDDLNKSP